MRLLGVVSFFLFAMPALAQQAQFSFYARANHILIPDISYVPTAPVVSPNSGFSTFFANVGVRQTFEESFGFDLGAEASFKLSGKVSIRSGLGVQQFRFQQRFESISTTGAGFISAGVITRNPILPGTIIVGTMPDDTPTGAFRLSPIVSLAEPPEKLGKTSTLYLTLPVMVDYTPFSKWTFSVGMSASILASAARYKEEYQFDLNMSQIVLIKDTSGDGFQNVLVNGHVQVNYFITPKISLDLGGSYSISPIFDKPPVDFGTSRTANYASLSLGSRYWFRR